MKVGGAGASFAFTVAATTVERTLTYYIGGWNSTGRITVTLPGAPTYTTTFSSASSFRGVITVWFRADAAGTLRVNYTQTVGAGTIKMQARLEQDRSIDFSRAPVAARGAEHRLWQTPLIAALRFLACQSRAKPSAESSPSS